MIVVVKLVVIFFCILIFIKLTKLLPVAVLAATVVTVVLFQMNAGDALIIAGKALISQMTIYTLLAFYTITFLQRMLEKRNLLIQAQQALSRLFNSRRINASVAPMLIGILPSPAAVTICGAIVNDAVEDHLTVEEKTFVTSYFRHIPEAILPTYSSIIIGVQLTGVPMSSFLLSTIPMVLVLILLGYLFYLRRIPKKISVEHDKDQKRDIIILVKSIWSLFAAIILIIAFNIPVFMAIMIVSVLGALIGRFKWSEIVPLFRSSFELKLILSTLTIMMFKDIFMATKALNVLPGILSGLPIPRYIVFILIFFAGTVIVGQQAINVIALPIAFASMPEGGVSLLMLLMSTGYAAMQVSPTHICLAIVIEYFKIDLGSLVKKTIPVIACYFAILIPYYLFLTVII
jgi:hypothetical protein